MINKKKEPGNKLQLMIVKGKATVDASGGRDALVSGSPAGKGQKEKQRLELQESRVNPACFIWLVSLNELL